MSTGDTKKHHHHAKKIECVSCAVVTVSDTRTTQTDQSGSLIRSLLGVGGHRVIALEIVPDDPERVRNLVVALCDRSDCQAVLMTGGTGLAERDTTYEAIESLLEKRLDGFGELFRMLSYQEIGASAMLSRAMAGVCRGTVIVSMPGSPAAVRLAMEKLILPTLGHVAAIVGN